MTDTLVTVGLTVGSSFFTAIVVVVITYVMTKKREHEADWRKLKFEQYKEFLSALSGIVEGRATPEAHRRFADAFNIMTLIAPMKVLTALREYQMEISYVNKNRTQAAHDRAFNMLLRAIRADVHPILLDNDTGFNFMLLDVPEGTRGELSI